MVLKAELHGLFAVGQVQKCCIVVDVALMSQLNDDVLREVLVVKDHWSRVFLVIKQRELLHNSMQLYGL